METTIMGSIGTTIRIRNTTNTKQILPYKGYIGIIIFGSIKLSK